jgi:RNA polymerase sigma-70 factor (ECF subfamily)
MVKAEEQRLIRLAAAGDRDSAQELIKAHQRSLYAYLYRLSGRSDVAEDGAQDAFVRVLTNLDRFDPRFRFSTWLFTIARRLFLNFREKRRPMNGSEAMGAWGSESGRPEGGVVRAESNVVAKDALQRALMGLSLDQREVMVLFHQLDWPIWLIAEHLGMPEGTVKSHLHRGRRRLREVLAAKTVVTTEQTLEEAWL